MTAPAIPESATLIVRSDLLATEFDAGFVVLNLQDGVYYGLEDVGGSVWKLLQKPVTVTAIRDALLSEYDVDSSRCERDLKALLDQLISRGLVQVLE